MSGCEPVMAFGLYWYIEGVSLKEIVQSTSISVTLHNPSQIYMSTTMHKHLHVGYADFCEAHTYGSFRVKTTNGQKVDVLKFA